MVNKGIALAVALGMIAAAGLMSGCEKKSDSEAGAKSETPAAAEAAKPAEAPAAEAAKPAETPAAEAPKSAETPPAEKPAEAKPAAAAAPAPFDPAHPYTKSADGKFNFAVYRGFNLFANVCSRCHGENALGSSFAPALVDSLKTMSYEDFVATVMNGRTNITSSQTNVMPTFGENPSIVKYIDSIYAYLKARADGVLEPGVPEWTGPKE